MAQNMFEALQHKKQRLLELAEKAADFSWIPRNRPTDGKGTDGLLSLEEIKERLDKDTLTIGVIGQMKCGKSTFLNAFVFEDNILPTATTPMTSALSIITYGPQKHITVEFYTKDEWEEQLMQASRHDADAADHLDASRIKAAKELVSKAAKLGDNLDSYLGTTQDDTYEHLIEYVGAEGKYVSITKSVTIYWPNERLKGVEVVDTPGFNDPIVSREERTKAFLKQADAVIMMLYAGRPFDATDRDIIFKHIKQCGIGKLLIGINKYDIPYCSDTNPEDELQIKEYVQSEIDKACREAGDSTVASILDDAELMPLSAEMALLSKLPMSAIAASESLSFAYKRHCTNFGIGTQSEMYRLSYLEAFEAAIRRIIEREKDDILFARALNAIKAAGETVHVNCMRELNALNDRIDSLLLSDTELDEKEENLAKAHRRLTKKIDLLSEDLDAEIRNIVRHGKRELEDLVDASCKRMRSIVHGEWGQLTKFEAIRPRIEEEMQLLVTRKLKRATEQLAYDGKRKMIRDISDFFADAEELLMRYLSDFDSRDFVRSTQHRIQMDIETSRLFSYDSESSSLMPKFGLGDVLWRIFNSASGGLFGIAELVLSHRDHAAKVETVINAISSQFDPLPYLNHAFKRKDTVIASVRAAFMADLIEPLQQQIQEVRSMKDGKEKELKAMQTRRDVLMAQAADIDRQRRMLFDDLF